jgi:2-phosphoglycerate kinase
MTSRRRWHVLLVGGASGSGKTTLAVELGRRYGVNVAQLDDIQVALTAVCPPREQPALHFWRTNWDEFSEFTDSQHLDHFVSLSSDLFDPVIRAVVADRLDGGLPCIIEGDFILPETVAALAGDDERVRGLFLREDDEAQAAANLFAREGGDVALRARTSSLASQWLGRECERVGMPSIDARPWDTAVDRAIELLEA